MAIIGVTSSELRNPEKDKFSELIRSENQVTDMLSGLEQEVMDNGSERDKQWLMFDNYIESLFDDTILNNKNNRTIIENHIKNGDYAAITTLLNTWIDNDPGVKAMLENIETAVGRDITIELNSLELGILKNTLTPTNNPNGIPLATAQEPEYWNNGTKGRNTYKAMHEFIDKDPRNRSYQALSPLQRNEAIDANSNGKVTKREMKKGGIIDRYRYSDKDVRDAVHKILNWADGSFSKAEIGSINRQDLTNILTEVLHDYYSQNTAIREPKAFRKYFRETFVKTDSYKKTGLWARKDMQKFIGILEEWLEDKGIQQALNHLADMGEKARNINIVWASNDLELLQNGAVTNKNVFLFLCDFDSNGTIDSTNISKQKPNESRRDTWSVMGLQLYQNMASLADLDAKNIITDGSKTAALIQNILLGARSKSKNNSALSQAIDNYISKENEKWDEGYSLKSFINFMGSKWEYKDHMIGGAKTVVPGVTAIKSYLESLAQESNEWSGDVSDIFVSIEQRKDMLQENAEQAVDISHIYGVIDKSLEWHNYGEAELAYTRRTIADKVLQFVNYFTDTLYVNMDTDGKLASIFHGEATPSAIGKIQQKFYFPDGTRNEQLIKDELGKYINNKIIPTFGVAVDATGNPIIGVGVWTQNTSGDLTKRFAFDFNVGATLPMINWIKGQIPRDFRLGVAVNIEKTRQTKASKTESKNQNRKDLVPTTRVGLHVGAGYEFVINQFYLKAWPVRDRDFPAGIEQKWREFDYLLTTLLNPQDHNFQNGQDYAEKLKQKISNLAEKDDRIGNNIGFLKDMADALGQKMEWAGVFAILNSPAYVNNLGKKTHLLNFFYNQFIDGFHENAVNQDLYNQLAGQGVKITKVNIAAIVGTSIAAIALAPITGWLSMASVVPAVAAGVRMSTFRNSFVPDKDKTRSNYEKIQTHKNMNNAPEFESLQEAAKHLEQQINVLEPGKPNILTVTANDETGHLHIKLNKKGMDARNISLGTIFTYLNIYHADDAKNGFHFENGELILGDVDLHIARIVQKDKVEFHLMLGKDVKTMSKLTWPLGSTDKSSVKWYEKQPESPKPLTKQMVQTLVDGLGDVADKQALVDIVWDRCKNIIPPVTRGDLLVKKYPDGTYKVTYTPNSTVDKLTLTFQVVVDSKKTERKEISGSSIRIDLWTSFEYISSNPDNYEQLRNSLDNLGKHYKNELFETADAARNQKADLLYTFLEPLSRMNYEKAAEQLIKVLENGKVDAYNPFIEKLKDSSLADNQRVLICNKFKHLLAYNATSIKLLTGGTYSNINKLWWLVDSRKTAYEAMAREKNMPSIFRPGWEYYNALRDKTKDWTSYEIQDAHNTIGYTAFYRTAAKHFGIAHPGETKIVKNGNDIAKVYVQDIADVKKTGDWYFNQLVPNSKEFAIIKKNVNKKLQSAGIEFRINTVGDLKAMVVNKRVAYISSKDKTKKESLTFDAKFVFYLMWECTNESVGLELGNIQIRKEQEVPMDTIDTGKTLNSQIAPGKKPPVFVTKRKDGLYNNEYDIQTRQRDLTLAGALRIPTRVTPPTDWPTPDGENPPIDDGGPDGENPPIGPIDRPTPDWENPIGPIDRPGPDGENPPWWTPPGDTAGGGGENG